VRTGIVGVQAHQRRKIEGHTQPCLAVFQQIFEPSIRVLGCPVSGKLSHGPEPAPIHGGIDPARIGKLTRSAEIGFGSRVLEIVLGIESADLQSGQGRKSRVTLVHHSLSPQYLAVRR
jgi:hypothetical protein